MTAFPIAVQKQKIPRRMKHHSGEGFFSAIPQGAVREDLQSGAPDAVLRAQSALPVMKSQTVQEGLSIKRGLVSMHPVQLRQDVQIRLIKRHTVVRNRIRGDEQAVSAGCCRICQDGRFPVV